MVSFLGGSLFFVFFAVPILAVHDTTKYGGNYHQCRDHPPRWINYRKNPPEEYLEEI